MQIGNGGQVRLCCQSKFLSDAAGKPLSVYEKSEDEIWNSKHMREIRHGMIEGKQVTECTECWKQESHGGVSRRMAENAMVDRTNLKSRLLKLLNLSDPLGKIRADALRNDFFVHSSPVDLELEVGNVCNLKCRMCSPAYSSKIESDPVHSKWFDNPDEQQEKGKRNIYPLSRLPEKKHWFKEKQFIYGELLKQPRSIRKIIFKGGEPFLSKEAVDILEYLSKQGDGRKIEVDVVTNGTVVEARLFKALARFDRAMIAVSLDGVGNLYEYIRYPAKWSAVEENLKRFSKLSNVVLMTSITFQAYNALQIVDLFRFCNRYGYEINQNALSYPAYLAAAIIPPKARKMAIERIRGYVESDCKQKNRASIGALATALEALGDQIDVENLKKFMLFTNDLDQSRVQKFRDVHAELLGYIEEAGIEWSSESRFARHG